MRPIDDIDLEIASLEYVLQNLMERLRTVEVERKDVLSGIYRKNVGVVEFVDCTCTYKDGRRITNPRCMSPHVKVRTCVKKGCKNRAIARGMCNKHYQAEWDKTKRKRNRKVRDT